MNKISIVIITKNEQNTIAKCLDSLKEFDEVLIYDNGSTDKTLQIASRYENVTSTQGQWFGFGKTKAHAVSLAKNEWVFSLDADEIISDSLTQELLHMPLDKKIAYEVQRDNYYNQKLIRCCGWYGEKILRFFNKNETNFNDAVVHEKVEQKNLKVVKLNNVIKHYSFHCVADFMDKIQKYSQIYAQEHQGKKSASISKAIIRGKFMFFKSYILQGGYKAGFEGFVISFFAGLGTFTKYIKLAELNKKLKKSST